VAKTVLVVDSDLGFVFWLGRLLTEAGYEAFPAKTAKDAMELVPTLELAVDLLVVNPAQPGIINLIKAIHASNEHVRVMAVRQSEEQSAYTKPGEGKEGDRPAYTSDVARREWLEAVARALAEANARMPSSL